MNNKIKKRKDVIYLKFQDGQQTAFLRLVKNKCFDSWEQLADFLRVNRNMIFLYLAEKSKLPISSFNKMIKISKLNKNDFSFKLVPYLIHRESKIPKKITPNLAEFIGIMLGDGCIYKPNSQITISCGEIDKKYILQYILDLVKNLFSKNVSFRKITKGGLDCRFCSKKVCNYLNNEMNFIS